MRVARVVRLDELLALVVVDAALVAQLAVLVEEEDVRRGDGAELDRDRLGLAVVEIRPGRCRGTAARSFISGSESVTSV